MTGQTGRGGLSPEGRGITKVRPMTQTNDQVDHFAEEVKLNEEFKERQTRARQVLQDIKLQVIAKAKAFHLARIEVTYNGEGDEGQIENIVGYRHRMVGEVVDEDESELLVDMTDLFVNEEKGRSLADDVDDFTWEVLGVEHDGFEIDDGGSGHLVIDVVAATVKLTRNDHYTAMETSEVEV